VLNDQSGINHRQFRTPGRLFRTVISATTPAGEGRDGERRVRSSSATVCGSVGLTERGQGACAGAGGLHMQEHRRPGRGFGRGEARRAAAAVRLCFGVEKGPR